MTLAATSIAPSSEFPLQWLLDVLIAEARVPQGTVAISVADNVHCSTHSSEVLSLKTPDSKALKLFCKHGAPSDESWLARGHRGGISYEADVYRRVLVPLALKVPAFYAALHNTANNEHYLVLEHLDGALAVSKSEDPDAMPEAARWAGRLHALAEPKVANREIEFLIAHNKNYYFGWARRTLEFSRLRGVDVSWITRLCSRYEALVELLVSAAHTVIHGEYYPKNVLMCNGAVYPVDWESAAIAAGEVDLASLTQGWSSEVMYRCAQAYSQARWGRAPAENLLETITAGHLYWRFRWLGNSFDWSTGEGFKVLLEDLYSFAKDRSLI